MKRKRKSITDYWQKWHTALLALLFFGFAIAYVLALAGDVKQNTYDIIMFKIKELNSMISTYQMKYSCYPDEKTCIPKIQNNEERIMFEKILFDKSEFLKKIEK